MGYISWWGRGRAIMISRRCATSPLLLLLSLSHVYTQNSESDYSYASYTPDGQMSSEQLVEYLNDNEYNYNYNSDDGGESEYVEVDPNDINFANDLAEYYENSYASDVYMDSSDYEASPDGDDIDGERRLPPKRRKKKPPPKRRPQQPKRPPPRPTRAPTPVDRKQFIHVRNPIQAIIAFGKAMTENGATSAEMIGSDGPMGNRALLPGTAADENDPLRNLEHTVFRFIDRSGVDHTFTEPEIIELQNYGCWCPKLLREKESDALMGRPLDGLDLACREWFRCRRCSSLDPYYCNIHKDYDYDLEFFNVGGRLSCESLVDAGSPCEYYNCLCDAQMVINMMEKIGELDPLKVGIDNDQCVRKEREGGGSTIDSCCGAFPFAKPYASGEEICIDNEIVDLYTI